MPSRSRKKIALFGGSFNPPHEGHREIVRHVARRKGIDEVWVLPAWRHPFRKRLPAFEKRVRSCRTCLTRLTGPTYLKKIKIKAYEKHPHSTGYTVDLLLYLKKRFPRYRWWWVMGADTYRQRKRWRDFKKIKKLARLIVFPRGPRSPIPNVASRLIRRQGA